ncbi:uncharacterized protein [Asterias amurensis]|uniref:uncharacterized protein isoform X2 n=1 Tax=Asterias amurensis TaxID=7602 RepID=UPI003AB5D38C
MADKTKARSNSAPMVKYGTMQNPRTTAKHKARSNSAHDVKYHTMRPTSSCANQKKTCETDKGHELKETDEDVVIKPSEQSEENEIPPSGNPDNLNQGMAPSRSSEKKQTSSNSAHSKYHTMPTSSSCANQKKTCETDKGHELKETDEDVVIKPSEQSEENEIPPSGNPDNLNQGMAPSRSSEKKQTSSNSAHSKYHTMKTCETDKGHELKETDEDVVIKPSEQSEENEIPPSGNPDNLNQGMAPSRSSEKKQTSSNSAHSKYHTMRPTSSCANQKKTCETDKGHELKETDEDVVIKPSEQSEENEIPPSGNPDILNQGMPRSRSCATNKYNTWAPSRSSEKKQTSSNSAYSKYHTMMKADCNCKQGANEGNGQKETGAEGCDQPDAAPKTLQSIPVAEVLDKTSVDLAHEFTFRELSQNIGREWEPLATYLGVGEKEIEHIKYDNPNNIKQQIYCMLLKWKSLCDDFGSSSFLVLADHLERVERKPLAAELRGNFK